MDIFDVLLSATPRINDSAKAALIERFGSAEALFNSSMERLLSHSELTREGAEIILAQSAMAEAMAELSYCKTHNITPIAATDEAYPALLREISNPPHVVYTIGNTEILNRNLVSFVGTRKISPYGDRACVKIIKQLADTVENLVIVSGLAFGVDSVAHRAALDLGIPTIAVLPSPLPTISPAAHNSLARQIVDEGGLLLSELRSTQRNTTFAYIPRNRIVAGLSAATVIVESPLKGGSMRTVEIAESQGRLVAAVPGRITDENSSGCNALIARGVAIPLLRGEDLVERLHWARKSSDAARSKEPSVVDMLRPDLRGLLGCFRFDEPLHITQLGELSSMNISELNGALIELEIYGTIRALPGSMYERIVKL